MKGKIIIGIFAHPDDEAFGPGGTIAQFAKDNTVYLICVTNGDAATGTPDPKLGEVRRKELQNSAKILGVKEVFFLDFLDGTLCNNLYHKIANKIKEKLDILKPEVILTYEPRGISGHIDHITVAMVSGFLFQRLPYIKELWQYAIEDRPERVRMDYFIYFPNGYKRVDVDEVVNTDSVWETKVKAMKQHKSQIKDVDAVKNVQEKLPKEEWFLVTRK